MTTIAESVSTNPGNVLFVCDFSPPRAGSQEYLQQAELLDVDFICVAYSPGKSVRADSAIAAYNIRCQTGKEVIFNLTTRDMNRLAIQNHLLVAQMLGLQNILVLRGDRFNQEELAAVRGGGESTPTSLIRDIRVMNDGYDYKGRKLRNPTEFCVGAAVDLGRDVIQESTLAHRKSECGADFFLAQPIYDTVDRQRFLKAYASVSGAELLQPIFWGLQILDKNGIVFGPVPKYVRDDLQKDRSGVDIAVEMLAQFVEDGIRTVYLIPPILKGGLRDYESAQQVVETFKRTMSC